MENHFPKRLRLSQPLPNRRTQQRNEPCLKFQRGSCSYGDRCCFLHSGVDKRLQDLKTRFCWRYMNGEECQYGDKCHFIHVNVNEVGDHQRKHLPWRKKLCIRWMTTELQNQGLNYAGGGLCKLVDKKVEGKLLKVKWQNHEKISGVYADWIDDMPIVFHTV
ncbi:uncharacterized protein LOC143565927 [Bidens hawaiensis]|uniref:uncharacterized protein LOC143565927 n=1 Tax=Bidens hawaiensis TaxID=980011 RepID=UPI00404A1D7A